MKNSLIVALLTLVVLFSYLRLASADERANDETNVVTVLVRDMQISKKGGKTPGGKVILRQSFEKPVTTRLKPCVTDNGSHRTCLYEVQGKTEVYVFDYTSSDDNIVVYGYETTVQTY